MASQMEASAKKTDETFLTDSGYILEQNLHKVRKELISLIEAFEHKDCSACKQLKCSCTGSSPPPAGPAERVEPASSGGADGFTGSTNSVDFSTVAPSANVLPKPMWENSVSDTSNPKPDPKDVESWVRASTPSAQPILPEVKAADWADNEGDAASSYPWFSFKSTDKKSSSDATTHTSVSAILTKVAYDFKGRSKPTLYWPGVTTSAIHASQIGLSPVYGSKPATKASAKTSSYLNPAKFASDSIGNNIYGLCDAPRPAPEVAAGRSAVDAFFHSFKKNSAAGVHADVLSSSSQLTSAFKLPQAKTCGYTYF